MQTEVEFEKKVENIVWVGNAGFEAHADRLIVWQDVYRSGFECTTCFDENKHTVSGREVSTIACEACEGSGKRSKAGNAELKVKCTECDGEGWLICPKCNGKGGNIVLPEDQKGKPTTGTIVSVGCDVTKFKLGNKVIYPSFAGHAYDFKVPDAKGKPQDMVLVVLREGEILSHMYGSLEQNQVKKSVALHTNA